jgi:hypothetical protein
MKTKPRIPTFKSKLTSKADSKSRSVRTQMKRVLSPVSRLFPVSISSSDADKEASGSKDISQTSFQDSSSDDGQEGDQVNREYRQKVPSTDPGVGSCLLRSLDTSDIDDQISQVTAEEFMKIVHQANLGKQSKLDESSQDI